MIPYVLSSSSVSDAIDVLQGDADRGVVVIDEGGHVVGILTEGDIVRAVRRGVLSESPVSQVMTGHAKVTTEALSDEQLAQEFADSGTLIVPIVDQHRRLLDVQRARTAVQALLDSV